MKLSLVWIDEEDAIRLSVEYGWYYKHMTRKESKLFAGPFDTDEEAQEWKRKLM